MEAVVAAAETEEGMEGGGMEGEKEVEREGIFPRRQLQGHRPLERLRREANATKGKLTWKGGEWILRRTGPEEGGENDMFCW
jgi:hypothetical protein